MYFYRLWSNIISNNIIRFEDIHNISSSSFFTILWLKNLFKVSNRNNGKRCEICSKLTIKATGRYYVALVSLLFPLDIFKTFFNVSTVDFEQRNVYWVLPVYSGNSFYLAKLLIILR